MRLNIQKFAIKSGTITFPKKTGDANWKSVTGKIDWFEESTDINSNTSPMTLKLYVSTDSGGTTGKSWTGSASIDGTKVINFTGFSSSKTISKSDGWVKLAEITTPVKHNDDGSKTITISGSVSGPSGTSLAGLTSSGSGQVTLTETPQASGLISVSGGTANYNPVVRWKPNSTTFKYKIVYSFGGWSYTTDFISPNTTDEYSYNGYQINANTIGPYMTAMSGTFTATLYTYKADGGQIGNPSQMAFGVNLPDYNLSISSSVVDVNASTKPNGGSDAISTFCESGWYIQGLSNPRISITTSSSTNNTYGKNVSVSGSNSISMGVINGGSITKTYDLGTGFNGGVYSFTASDGRKSSGTSSVTINRYNYYIPRVSIKLTRPQSTGSVVNYSVSYDYCNTNFKNSKTPSLVITYTEKGKSAVTKTLTMSSNSGTLTGQLGNNFNYKNSITYSVQLIDKIGYHIVDNSQIPGGLPAFNTYINNDGVNIMKVNGDEVVNGKFTTSTWGNVNTIDTWVPVWKDGYLEHRVIPAAYNNAPSTLSVNYANSSNIATSSTIQTPYFIYGADGDWKWVRLGIWTSAGDSSNIELTIHSGAGYNGQAYQNSKIVITIKDGWQSVASTSSAFGVTCEFFQNIGKYFSVKVQATSHNVCQVWVYMPWQYWNGDYNVIGRGTWENNITNQTNEPTTGVDQQVMYIEYEQTPTILYDDASGTSGQITLSESMNTFKYIEVFYVHTGETYPAVKSVKVPAHSSTTIFFKLDAMLDNGTYLYFYSESASIYNNVLYRGTKVRWRVAQSGGASTRTEDAGCIVIKRVIGYK